MTRRDSSAGSARKYFRRILRSSTLQDIAIECQSRLLPHGWLAVDQRALKKQKPHDNLGRALAEEEELQDSFAPAEQQVAVPVDDGTHALHYGAVLIGASGEQHTLPPASRPGDRLAAKRGDESSEPSKGAGPLHTTTAVVVTATPPPQTTEFPTLPLPKKATLLL